MVLHCPTDDEMNRKLNQKLRLCLSILFEDMIEETGSKAWKKVVLHYASAMSFSPWFLRRTDFKKYKIDEMELARRTYGFIESEKRLKTYSLKEGEHVVFGNEGWSNDSSFMKETLFKNAVRIP
ncbi:hypothetical protein Tco_0859624 [Tanacetum coccineum]|uniref:Uncharacterized protein n=1 Tax=Tanacetum coccineum TaxID=301880 RepID=A0ABQ5BFT9_9ASTR